MRDRGSCRCFETNRFTLSIAHEIDQTIGRRHAVVRIRQTATSAQAKESLLDSVPSIVGLGIHPVAVFASASSSASRAYSSAWPNVHFCRSEIINRRSTVAALASISTMT
jgi:hypothetical protein